MNINIQEIVDNKIKSLNDDGTIKNAIEKTIETTMLKSITDALGDYSLRRSIQDQVEKEVSAVVKGIGFTAYNSFIAEKVKQITEEVCRQDIAQKIQEVFNNILVIKRESAKLSEICKAYRDWICEEVEESEKYSLERFHVSIEEKEYPYDWLTFKFDKEKSSRYRSDSDEAIEFTVHRNYKDKNMGTIGTLYIGGYSTDKTLCFRNMSKIEALLLNFKYNNTPIEIDIESEDDIDNSFDVDI
ncbi:MAG TPA: hypothetical protein VD757_01710 [Candidatus Nitrosocosmicus sp.]|nr:hypothetical protein [Candidatus Nitrosocosmicus sp.]